MGLLSSVAFVIAGLMHTRQVNRREDALRNVLAPIQVRAALFLGVDPVPLESCETISSLATDGARILYNPGFCLWAIRRVCVPPGNGECAHTLLLAMVAHELYHAHHHMKRTSGPTLELEADEAAGYVLGRSGVQPGHFLEVLQTFIVTRDHPPAATREKAVRRGYTRGQADQIVASRR